jgi:hypothetical protein
MLLVVGLSHNLEGLDRLTGLTETRPSLVSGLDFDFVVDVERAGEDGYDAGVAWD